MTDIFYSLFVIGIIYFVAKPTYLVMKSGIELLDEIFFPTSPEKRGVLISTDLIGKFLNGFNYYDALSELGKSKFRNRIASIVQTKRFMGSDGLTVTDEMRIRVSATIAQITFGLENFDLDYFHTINIYPDIFYSKLYRKKFKGLTTNHGYIAISWKNYVEGYNTGNDNYNLGLHEMAHALKVEAMQGEDLSMQFAEAFDSFIEISAIEFQRMHEGKESYLRKYGGTNMHEFFAVCVEHFFESPSEFYQKLPHIFINLSLLLNQDPRETNNDYRPKEKVFS